MGVFFQVEQLPFLEIVIVNQFITFCADSVMSPNCMILRIAVIMVVDRISPVFWGPAFHDGFQADALHVVGDS